MEPVRVGVVGLGIFGQVHLKAYTGLPGAEVIGICDLDEERVRKAGEEYDVAARFRDYRELLAMDGLDAVSVVTPDFTHTDIVVAAVEQGRAVLVEKPLATTLNGLPLASNSVNETSILADVAVSLVTSNRKRYQV